MKQKFILTDDSIEIDDSKLYRIKAIRSFGNVKEGDLGGYVESTKNLSHAGKCWIYDDACVYENASVFDDALVEGNAHVYGDSSVYNNAVVEDDLSYYNSDDE